MFFFLPAYCETFLLVNDLLAIRNGEILIFFYVSKERKILPNICRY